MTTITLTLPEHIIERANQFAEERDITTNTLLETAVLEYLEELADLAEVRESSRQIKSGEIKTIPWSQVKAELLADPEMAEYAHLIEEESE